MQEHTPPAVVIGMDPHKRSVTIEAMGPDEAIVGRGRFDTDPAGYQAMLALAHTFSQRVWAIEGWPGGVRLSGRKDACWWEPAQ